MKNQSEINIIQANAMEYGQQMLRLRDNYLKFPRNISIETQVICNSRCIFCPYIESPRKGQKIKNDLFYKILEDLAAIPKTHKFNMTLHRLNEPLLDHRLESFHRAISSRFPQAHHQFWSNGTTITREHIDWMAYFNKASLTVSLNSINDKEHFNLMGISLDPVLQNLDALHHLKKSGKFSMPVILCAPYQNRNSSKEFTNYCLTRWPMFSPALRPFFKWTGGSSAGKLYRDSSGFSDNDMKNTILRQPCGQWFDLHILANGYTTKCCIDESGLTEASKDASVNNVLDIYQENFRLRNTLPSRTSVTECHGCFHLG